MEDARQPFPICNDQFAQRFMDANALRVFEPFRSETMPNITNATRCRIIDDILRSEMKPGTAVISIGAGFDTRPYRLAGGNWVELDEAPLLAYKNEKLPISECSNALRRVAIDFSRESLGDKLAGIDGSQPVIVVIEGVFMYLEPDAILANVRELRRLFPRHLLLCDLMNRRFFERFSGSVHAKLVAMGGAFTARPERPEELFIQQGYVDVERIPMVQRALQLGVFRKRLGIPDFVLKLLLKTFLRDLNGYAIFRFQSG
jgi:methyltransferase (TIGR00027 family)